MRACRSSAVSAAALSAMRGSAALSVDDDDTELSISDQLIKQARERQQKKQQEEARKQQEEKKPASVAGDQFVCQYTKKRFKTRATYENYIQSKKYAALAAKAEADESKAAAAAAAAAASRGEHQPTGAQQQPQPAVESGDCGADTDDDNAAGTDAGTAGAGCIAGSMAVDEAMVATLQISSAEPRLDATPVVECDGDGDGETDGETDSEEGWVDDDEPWEPRWMESLFDGHTSDSFEENVAYMQTAHSFFVPDRAHLADAAGLFAYLQEKVCRFCTCLHCNRAFVDVAACRHHMVQKSHCRVNVDADDGALELCVFYEYESEEAPRSGVELEAASALRRAAFIDGDQRHGGELVLPSGARLGHRSLRRFYKQASKHEDKRLAVLAYRSERNRHRGGELFTPARLERQLALRREARRRHGVLVNSRAFALGGRYACRGLAKAQTRGRRILCRAAPCSLCWPRATCSDSPDV